MSEETRELSLGQKIKRFFKGVKAEYSKIIFPSRETLRKQTVAVIIVAVFLAVPYLKRKYFSKPVKRGGASNA